MNLTLEIDQGRAIGYPTIRKLTSARASINH